MLDAGCWLLGPASSIQHLASSLGGVIAKNAPDIFRNPCGSLLRNFGQPELVLIEMLNFGLSLPGILLASSNKRGEIHLKRGEKDAADRLTGLVSENIPSVGLFRGE
jgi:hypothetical protein